jgi:hypothetical protein
VHEVGIAFAKTQSQALAGAAKNRRIDVEALFQVERVTRCGIEVA